MRSSMEVNWEKTRALAEGSRASISASSSRSASILVLLWKPASFMRFRMEDFFALATFNAACSQHSQPQHMQESLSVSGRLFKRLRHLLTRCLNAALIVAGAHA